jgi:hypothetical protein
MHASELLLAHVVGFPSAAASRAKETEAEMDLKHHKHRVCDHPD